VTAIWEYTKTGSNTASTIHTFTIPTNGTYKIECWGAGGGTGYIWDGKQYLSGGGGIGAYAEGSIHLTTTTNVVNNKATLYFYVGGRGSNAEQKTEWSSAYSYSGGYNGGGIGYVASNRNDASGGGGGATDVRLTNGAWNNSSSLASRIMVAAGGGGGHAISGTATYTEWEGSNGGNPNVSGGLHTWTHAWTPTCNQFTGYQLGVGQPGEPHGHASGGGGGGYYGGVNWIDSDDYGGPASGGSSYISGNSNCSTHSSNLTFSPSSFTKGNNSQCPSMTIDGSPAALGRVNGYARITLVNHN
jgi:hypothetical protein